VKGRPMSTSSWVKPSRATLKCAVSHQHASPWSDRDSHSWTSRSERAFAGHHAGQPDELHPHRMLGPKSIMLRRISTGVLVRERRARSSHLISVLRVALACREKPLARARCGARFAAAEYGVRFASAELHHHRGGDP